MKRRIAALLAVCVVSVSLTARPKVAPYAYLPANCAGQTLMVFESDGLARTIALPPGLVCLAVGPDGKSIYAIEARKAAAAPLFGKGLLRIEFNPTRVNLVPGSVRLGEFGGSYTIASHLDKIVISGRHQDAGGRTCGIFELSLPNETIRKILDDPDCNDTSAWSGLSLSPTGERAVASRGRKAESNVRLELIDLVHGSIKPIGWQLRNGVWSPDGKWIAAIESSGREKLVLIDANDTSRRRTFGRFPMVPTWSPDSRYLLLWKWHLFGCGIGIDVDPPATFEILDVESGSTSTIRGSRCQLINGVSGWVSGEIVE